MKRNGNAAPGHVLDGAALVRSRVHLALYVAAATVLFVLERLVPNPLPWVRLGLANGVVLLVLVRHGAMAALWVQLGRLILGGLFAGTFLGPAFLLALTGGLGAWLVMAGAWRFMSSQFSLFGVSILGATAHGLAQLTVVASLFAAGRGIFALLPLFLGVALVTGACIGIVAQALLVRLETVRSASDP